MDPGSIIVVLLFVASALYVPSMIAYRRRQIITSTQTVMVVDKFDPVHKTIYAQGREYDPNSFNLWPLMAEPIECTIYRLKLRARCCNDGTVFIVEVDEPTYNSAEVDKFMQNPMYREARTRQEAVA